ncbi:hypothetical protein THAOC_27892 [Thalassiosira oceanica]|uniref:FAD-binding FR-type domain-containing protein n=1 Tax=Thalassiosira oceanica TaxID=159749 RepID=K0S1P1_THAOC|nr:hypothetical protein THAOC_27892 [Thalassiosira oceanica]|eukprot:EJK52797.1 hypothetical protein THAOC_27892 [Thalassiosira oceanica]
MSQLRWLEHVGAKAGWPPLLNLTIIALPTERLSRMMDFFYFDKSREIPTKTRLIRLHMEASVDSAIFLAIHAVMLSVVYAVRDREKFVEEMVPLTLFYTEGIVNFMGWVACIFVFFLWMSARPRVLDNWYGSVFVPVHIGSAFCYLLASNLHDYSALMLAWPALAEILSCRLMRIFSDRDVVNTRVQKVEHLDSVVRIDAKLPSSWANSQMLWPGKHVFLDGHPFSISSVDGDIFTLHIKGRGAWTNDLVRRADELQTNRQIDGLYGADLTPADHATSCIYNITRWGVNLLWTRGLIHAISEGASVNFQIYVTKMGDNQGDSFKQDYSPDQPPISTSMALPKAPGGVKLPSLAITTVVLICMVTSFLIARALCCSQSTFPVTCGLARGGSTQQCRSCNMDDVRSDDNEELPCCRIQICYLCFRGLPVVLVVTLAPAMAAAILWTCRKLSFQNVYRKVAFLFRGMTCYHSPAQDIVAVESAENGPPSFCIVDNDDEESSSRNRVGIPSEVISVHFGRPCIGTVLQSLWVTHEDEALETHTYVYVCGPESLGEDVQAEVTRHQSQNFANQYDLIVL